MGTGPGAAGSADWPTRDQLVSMVADGDLRILLMCLVHLTGDHRWLEPPYRPRRDVRLVADPGAGLPSDVAEQIRAAIVDLLVDGPPEPVLHDPGNESMVEMMSVCLGEEVPPEYAGMMREDMGFVSRDDGLEPVERSALPDVVIIGAGVSGLALGAQLGRIGVPYTIVEQNHEVGGTWHDNRYPGCGVDTPNHAYSFSFGTRYPWSRYFSLRHEIQDYLVRCADEFGVRPNIRFGTEVTGATWDEASQRWTITMRTRGSTAERPRGQTTELTAAVLVSALGILNVPKLPDIDGLDRFTGPSFHTARWREDVEIAGRRVAVVGTGASAMQLVPAIAGTARSVTVYQRSPQWARSIEGYRDDIPAGSRWLLEHLPHYVEWFRFTMLWRYGDGLLPLLRRDPQWPHPERAMNRVNDRHRQEMTDFIVDELADRVDLVPRCVPDYPPYGKRILLDNGWFRTLTRPDVELVTEPIQRVEAEGIVTADGVHRPADVVVLATGFETTQLTARLDIRGRHGARLADAWADDDPTAHLGISVPDFPNLFVMAGPNTGLGHGGSAMFQAECQARYISAMVLRMAHDRLGAVEVRRAVHDEYVRRVDAEHAELIWTHPGMTNWYRNRHGRITAIMPWRIVDYWAMTHDPDLDEYHTTPAIRPAGYGVGA